MTKGRGNIMVTKENLNPNVTARIAGILYLTMVPLGFFGMYGHSNLIVPGNAATTVNNIIASGSLFRLSIMSALVVQLVNILLVLVLYKLLKPVSRNYALLMVIFFLVSVPITMLNELNQFAALLLLSGDGYLTAFDADQLYAQVMFVLNLHEHGIHISGIFWGLWLFPMGYLVFKSGFLPRILGILLIIGCFGYILDSIRFFFFPGIKPIVLYTFWGELFLPLWLLIKGVNVEQWKKRALESA
jgi:hypothetical protein